MENYYCKLCGQKFSSVRTLTSNSCVRHPDGVCKGKHQLYEGAEKKEYACKLCGQKFSSLRTLTSNSCKRHPDGAFKGKHSPAM
jgi:DNA-directed RNA polymerase subunit RPC12/RpoP